MAEGLYHVVLYSFERDGHLRRDLLIGMPMDAAENKHLFSYRGKTPRQRKQVIGRFK